MSSTVNGVNGQSVQMARRTYNDFYPHPSGGHAGQFARGYFRCPIGMGEERVEGLNRQFWVGLFSWVLVSVFRCSVCTLLVLFFHYFLLLRGFF